jgi:hypothetical protein
MSTIVSTRFNTETWQENVDYRNNHNKTGCSYGAPYTMSPKIPLESIVFVLEMNNSKNKIEGIGLLKNKAVFESIASVHSERNYNRCSYHGKYRVSRDDIERINPKLNKILDHILFKEKTHLKRGIGFTSVPEKLLNHSVCEGLNIKGEIRQLFIDLFKPANTELNTTNEKETI